MRIAVKSTLTVLVLYLVGLAALALWTQHGLQAAASEVMESMARLIGREVAAVLREPIMDQLLKGDPAGRNSLKETVQAATEHSNVLSSIAVIGKTGEVLASDLETQRHQRFPTPEELFGGTRTPRVFTIPSGFLRPGTHVVSVPFVREGEIIGYLRMSIGDQPLAELYAGAASSIALVALAGLAAIVVLAVLTQVELNRLRGGLTILLEAAAGNQVASLVKVSKEFSPIKEAASKLGKELQNARGQAELARRELDSLARALRMGIILLGPDGRPEFVNDHAKELLAGTRLEEFDARLKEAQGQLEGAIDQLRQEGGLTTSVDLEVSPEGVSRRLRFELYTVDHQEWRGCLLLIKDRDTIDALDSDLRAATRFRGLSTLYVGAAHDLKAPLNAMVMNLELLRQTLSPAQARDEDTLGRQERYVEVITAELERLNRLLSALLAQTAPSREDRSSTDIRNLIRELEQLLAPQARHQRVALRLRLPDQPIVVSAYANELKQAFLNVIINALEAMPEGGQLDIALESGHAGAHLSVCDTGPGIPSALLPRIFEMHFTTKGSGTGIGLYVTRAAIEAHHGEIRVESRLGEGTCVHIALPLEQDPQERRNAQKAGT